MFEFAEEILDKAAITIKERAERRDAHGLLIGLKLTEGLAHDGCSAVDMWAPLVKAIACSATEPTVAKRPFTNNSTAKNAEKTKGFENHRE